MTTSLSSSQLTAALLETPGTSRLATCPLCHTPHASLTDEALQAGDNWRCVRCGQQWDARRLETVAAYAAWVAEHERVAPRRVSAAAVSTWDNEGGAPSSTREIGERRVRRGRCRPWLYGRCRTLARRIHAASARAASPFEQVAAATLPSTRRRSPRRVSNLRDPAPTEACCFPMSSRCRQSSRIG